MHCLFDNPNEKMVLSTFEKYGNRIPHSALCECLEPWGGDDTITYLLDQDFIREADKIIQDGVSTADGFKMNSRRQERVYSLGLVGIVLRDYYSIENSEGRIVH